MDGASLKSEILYVLTPMALPGIASTILLNISLDLSRFSAAPSARLSQLAFESDGTFPAQC